MLLNQIVFVVVIIICCVFNFAMWHYGFLLRIYCVCWDNWPPTTGCRLPLSQAISVLCALSYACMLIVVMHVCVFVWVYMCLLFTLRMCWRPAWIRRRQPADFICLAFWPTWTHTHTHIYIHTEAYTKPLVWRLYCLVFELNCFLFFSSYFPLAHDAAARCRKKDYRATVLL